MPLRHGSHSSSVFLAVVVLAFSPVVARSAEESGSTAGSTCLWRIGRSDNGNAEFALAPGRYGEYRDAGFFLIGKARAERDWPYVHPGPDDAWAGGGRHTFDIAFSIASLPQSGRCLFVIDCLDTHGRTPPRLNIEINGHGFERELPLGAGDASVFGEPDKGREHLLEVDFASEWLRKGGNHISITTLSGSWFLYDSVRLETPSGAALAKDDEIAITAVRSLNTGPMLTKHEEQLLQSIEVGVVHFGPLAAAKVVVSGDGITGSARQELEPGRNTIKVDLAPVEKETEVSVRVESRGVSLATRQVVLRPVRKWTVYILPHSHVDIGYTHLQTDVEQDHWRYYEQAIEAAQRTASYPDGAQFKWNTEVLWATESYLRQATPEKRQAFVEAVRAGWIGLDALYGNELTGLCRPEELVRLVDFAARLRREHDVPIESAMISDVPGYTWGVVPVLAQSGVRYFSIGPNGGHRIGHTLSEWGDKPFWWVSPCGQHRILCWIPRTGYWQGFRGASGLTRLLRQMEESDYPYDLVQIRHCLGDNAGPGTDLSEFVKDWNTRYAYPKLVIATTRTMMQAFEKRHGGELPVMRGDFTPYWEDGAASSARETALNRAAAERLVQAETLYSMLSPDSYPARRFDRAWRNVVLYDEHTWGAHCSISQPESEFTKSQWAIKQKFALDADAQSRELLSEVLSGRGEVDGRIAAVDVFNTTSWERTDLVVLPGDPPTTGNTVRRLDGKPVPSQRLTTGELAFLAQDVPALGVRRFTFHVGEPLASGKASAAGFELRNQLLRVKVDSKDGAIASFQWGDRDLVADGAGVRLNDYLYVEGRSPESPMRSGAARVRVGEPGPLVASLIIDSKAPGCHTLRRELRLIEGLDRLDITTTIDKKRIFKPEGVHIGFAFGVPDGRMRVDIPWAVARVEADQIPGACKNYLTVQRWVDVSNKKFGVTWATIDAPLVEVGRITCDPIRVGWLRRLEPSSTLYSYVMNNYWETNYKAGQEGPTTFRYSIRPHGPYDSAAAQHFGIERSQPLLVRAVNPGTLRSDPLLHVEPSGVVVTALRPTPETGVRVVRLFNTSGHETNVSLSSGGRPIVGIQRCNLAGDALEEVRGSLKLVPWEIATFRVQIPGK